jgi:hypothetical protein
LLYEAGKTEHGEADNAGGVTAASSLTAGEELRYNTV